MRLAHPSNAHVVAAAVFCCAICSPAAAQEDRRAQQLEQLLKRNPKADANKYGKLAPLLSAQTPILPCNSCLRTPILTRYILP